MEGRALAERIRAQVAEDVRVLGEVGLATVLVGDDPASEIYIRLKHTAAVAESAVLATCNRTEVYATVDRFHAGMDEVTAILSDVTGVPLLDLAELR